MPPTMGSGKPGAASVAVVSVIALFVTAAASGELGGLYELTMDELTGPVQPIDYSHKLHAGTLLIPCLYCHFPADRSQHATVPALSVCMGCHTWVKKVSTPEGDYRESPEIQKVTDFYQRGEAIPWVRIHYMPEHVQFKHSRHVKAAMACEDCHADVKQMNRYWLVPDQVLRPSSGYLPAAKLEMGWCMDCHLQPKEGGAPGEIRASDDCLACHY